MMKTNTWPVYRAPSEPRKLGEGLGLWRLPCTPQPPPGLLTEVEVAPLVLGLEEAAPGLSVDVGSLGHEQLHVVFAATLDGDVQGGLTWRGGGEVVSQGSSLVAPKDSDGPSDGRSRTGHLCHTKALAPPVACEQQPRLRGPPACRVPDRGTFQTHKRL